MKWYARQMQHRRINSGTAAKRSHLRDTMPTSRAAFLPACWKPLEQSFFIEEQRPVEAADSWSHQPMPACSCSALKPRQDETVCRQCACPGHMPWFPQGAARCHTCPDSPRGVGAPLNRSFHAFTPLRRRLFPCEAALAPSPAGRRSCGGGCWRSSTAASRRRPASSCWCARWWRSRAASSIGELTHSTTKPATRRCGRPTALLRWGAPPASADRWN